MDKPRSESAARYLEYIQSDEWRAVRKRYRESHEWKCAVCGVEVNLHLHHRTYKRLGRERLSDLIPLCEFHHAEAHRMERAGVQLWQAHEHVGFDKTVLPPALRKGRKNKKKQKIKTSFRTKKGRGLSKQDLWCTTCRKTYAPRHPSLRCECGGFIVYQPEPDPRRLARRRHPAGK